MSGMSIEEQKERVRRRIRSAIDPNDCSSIQRSDDYVIVCDSKGAGIYARTSSGYQSKATGCGSNGMAQVYNSATSESDKNAMSPFDAVEDNIINPTQEDDTNA